MSAETQALLVPILRFTKFQARRSKKYCTHAGPSVWQEAKTDATR